jgi:hypothetical protein
VAGDARIVEKIRRFHTDSGATFGSPRITPDLCQDGEGVNAKRVARLMRLCERSSEALVCGHMSLDRWPYGSRLADIENPGRGPVRSWRRASDLTAHLDARAASGDVRPRKAIVRAKLA